MHPRLAELVPLLRCAACGGNGWTEARASGGPALTCAACAARYPLADDVLAIEVGPADETVEAERAAVLVAERLPGEGGHGDFDEFASATGPLRTAILTLPWGDESHFYAEPGYFANVRKSAAAFDWVRANLATVPGARLLDVGADLTWSTAGLARSGFDCTAIDINHHLPLARLFQDAFDVTYRLVKVDAHVPCFQEASFDVVTAFSALHHSHRLDELVGNLARVLKPGGRFGLVEPYCVTEDERQRFGREQIDLGINENVYMLAEWHAALRRAGLRQRTIWLSGSFNAIYVKDPSVEPADDDPLARFYGGSITAIEHPTEPVRPGESFSVGTRVANTGNATWSSGGTTPVNAGYHLARLTGTSCEVVAFDNPRSPLSRDIPPGSSAWCEVAITAPDPPGTYEIDLDLVHERISWFRDRGFSGAVVRFVVD